MTTADEDWAARKAKRGSTRSCNPETEFRLGHAAATSETTAQKLNAKIAWATARKAIEATDKAIAERDASREVNAEFLAARSAVVADHQVCTTELATEKYGREKDYVWMLAKVTGMRIELDAANAVIAAAKSIEPFTVCMRSDGSDNGETWVQQDEMLGILAQSPTDALAAHDREVAATALDKARDEMMPPLNWNLDPYTGNERPGTSSVDQVYGDVHREMTEAAAEYRAVSE
ncbi:hypothetical protein [Cryobacterium aureum]|uniref:hypothetical protein n=1 Tax=Cryobacterium aureum TaxID=995037 RepID=UPI000CF39B15|nr:hypothetical protein [Cryobacterium aureum]